METEELQKKLDKAYSQLEGMLWDMKEECAEKVMQKVSKIVDLEIELESNCNK